MAKLDVTPADVRRIAGRLRRLRDAFADLDDDASRHASVPVAGDARVAARLVEFTGNWRERRIQLIKQMAELAGQADRAATAYEETDRRAGVD